MGFRYLAILLVASSLASLAPAQTGDEYQVKGAFVFNFAKFIEWPPEAFKAPSDSLVICVLGQDQIAGALRELVRRSSINGRPGSVRQLAAGQPVEGCHILFVGSSQSKRFRATSGNPAWTLLVGETPGFAASGGIINFKLEDGRVRFEINAAAAEREQFHISAKLLSLAQIVKSHTP
jgi:hypothetical protein